MTFISPTEQEARLRREQLENGGGANAATIANLQRQIDELNAQVNPASPEPPIRQGINQMIRNSDFAHSVDTWFEATPSGTDEEHECANVYTYPKLDPIDITDAEITAADKTLSSSSNPFTADMVGRYVQVEGAGSGGDTLITFIASFTNSGEVELDAAAATSVVKVNARINLQKFAHRNTKNTVSTVNDALKASTHSDIGSNISDPDWHKTRGMAQLGSDNLLVHTLGHFADNGTTYVPLHQLFPGREPFVRVNVAKKSRYAHSSGRFFIGLYNNSEEVLDWIRAEPFTLSGVVDGSPSGTVSTDYMVVIETDLGYTLVSDVLTIADAPDDTGFAQGARVRIRWQYFAATTRAKFYRRRSGGNVYLMETVATGVNSWTDVNRSTAQDTGSTSFPVVTDSANALPSYWSSELDNLSDMPVDGAPGEYWMPIEVFLPFPPTVDLGKVNDPHLVFGFTEPLSTLIEDGEISGATLTSDSGIFTADMVGKTVKTALPNGTKITATISAYTDANTVTLGTSPGNGTELQVEILDSQPNGFYLDLVGLSLNEGEWDFHPDDNNRPQHVAANPNGSPQGGTGGQNPTGGGGTGGPTGCPQEDQWIPVDDGEENVTIRRAGELTTNDRCYNPISGTFHRIKTAERRKYQPICRIGTEGGTTGRSSVTHPLITSEADTAGVPAGNLRHGNTVRAWSRPDDKLSTEVITEKSLAKDFGTVIFIELEDGGIYAYSDDGILFIICHNAKPGGPGIPPIFD